MSTLNRFDYLDNRKLSKDIDELKMRARVSNQLLDQIELLKVFPGEDQDNVLLVTKQSVYGFGSNKFGRLGFGHNIRVNEPKELTQLKEKRVTKIFIAYNFVLALTQDNRLYSWGKNQLGQLGRGFRSGEDDYLVPGEIEFFRGQATIKQIVCSGQTTIVVLTDGKVFVWGENVENYLGDLSLYLEPESLILPENVQANLIYRTSTTFFLISKDTNVYSWGNNAHHNLGHDTDIEEITTPSLIPNLTNVIDIVSVMKTYFLTEHGQLYHCGFNHEFHHDGFVDNINYVQIPELMVSQLKFIKLNYMEDNYVALSVQDVIYQLEGSRIGEFEIDLVDVYQEIEDLHIRDRNFRPVCSQKSKSIIGDIGSGAFGKVYLTTRQGESVALKKILTQQMTKELHNENSELEIMLQLKNPFVIEVFDYWLETQHDLEFLFIEMELCDESLEQFIKRKTSTVFDCCLDYVITCEIIRQLLEGLHYLHSMSLVHRDLKPTNVLIKYLDQFAMLKLCDFGLSRVIGKQPKKNNKYMYSELTDDTLVDDQVDRNKDDVQVDMTNVGTPGYTAPEVGQGDYNEKVDIFSLGVIVQQLLAIYPAQVDQHYPSYCKICDKLARLRNVQAEMVMHEPGLRPSVWDISNTFIDWSFNKQEVSMLVQANIDELDVASRKFIKSITLNHQVNHYEIFSRISSKLFDQIKFYIVFNDECDILFVTRDDIVYGLGKNEHGQLGLGHNELVERPEKVPDLSGKLIKDFFFGYQFGLGLTTDAKHIYSWGEKFFGQLGRDVTNETVGSPCLVEFPIADSAKIVEVSVNRRSTFVLFDNYKLYQFGLVDDISKKCWTPETVCDLSCNRVYNFGPAGHFIITMDKNVYSWGINFDYYLGHEDDDEIRTPNLVTRLAHIVIVDLVHFRGQTYFFSDMGSIYFCGELQDHDLYGMIDSADSGYDESQLFEKYPTLIETDQKFLDIGISDKSVIALSVNGVVFELKAKQAIETKFRSFDNYYYRNRLNPRIIYI